MNHQLSDESVRVTGEERLHPALRKLGRACIALARWQREQQTAPAESPSDSQASDPSNTPQAPHATPGDQGARDA